MWFLRPPKSRWTWHVFTWLAAVPALVFVALVQVAGEYSYDNILLVSQPRWYFLPKPDAISFTQQEEGEAPDFDDEIDTQFNGLPKLVSSYDHGWPIPWLHRERASEWPVLDNSSGYFLGHWVRWGSSDYWPLYADAWQIAPLGLILNLCITASVIAFPMLAAETWLRRRGGLGRFKIIDFLALMLLIAAGLGFWRWDQRETEWEHEFAYHLEYVDRHGSLSQSYVGPEWIERLTGDYDLVPFLHRRDRLLVEDCDVLHLDYVSLSKLQSLRTFTNFFDEIRLRGIVSRTNSEPAVREDRPMGAGRPISLAPLSRLPQVRELELWKWSEGTLSIDFRPDELRALTQIKSVRFDQREGDLKTVLALRHLPHLEEIHLRTDWYFDDELAILRSTFAGVKINSIGDPRRPPYRDEQITVRRWGPGCELTSDARTLTLTIDPAISANRFKEIESILPRLKKLILDARSIDSNTCEYFTRMTSLEILVLDLEQFPADFTDHIAKIPTLRRLRFEHRNPSLESLMPLKEHKQLVLSFGSWSWDIGDDSDAFRKAFGERIEADSP